MYAHGAPFWWGLGLPSRRVTFAGVAMAQSGWASLQQSHHFCFLFSTQRVEFGQWDVTAGFRNFGNNNPFFQLLISNLGSTNLIMNGYTLTVNPSNSYSVNEVSSNRPGHGCRSRRCFLGALSVAPILRGLKGPFPFHLNLHPLPYNPLFAAQEGKEQWICP